MSMLIRGKYVGKVQDKVVIAGRGERFVSNLLRNV